MLYYCDYQYEYSPLQNLTLNYDKGKGHLIVPLKRSCQKDHTCHIWMLYHKFYCHEYLLPVSTRMYFCDHGCPSLLTFTFSTSQKGLYRIWRNFAGRKYSMSSTKFVFRPSRKTNMTPLPRPLIGRDILLCHRWHFPLLCDRWTKLIETLQEASTRRPLPSVVWVLFKSIWNPRWRLWPLIDRDINHFSATLEKNSTKHDDRKQDLNVLFQVYVFRVDRKTKMAALASDWWRFFQYLLTTERNSTKFTN